MEERGNLPLGARDVEVRFTAVGLRSPEAVTFDVRLKGFDESWIPTAGRRWVRYTNLPPGRYEFRVRAANEDGFADEAGASVTFAVPPFYYETLWFRGLSIALFGLVLYGGYRVRVGAIERRNP